MAKKKTVTRHTYNADGTETHEEIEVAVETPKDPAAEAYAESNLSAARQRLLSKLKAPSGPVITSVVIDGERWYVRQTSLDEHMVQAIKISRAIADGNKRRALDMNDTGHVAQVIAATLELCCVQGAEDVTPLFSEHEEAFALATNPATARFAKELFNAALVANPDILPNLLEG